MTDRVKCASMNIKLEYRSYKIARLTVNQSEWETKKEVEIIESIDGIHKGEMYKL